MGIGNDYTELSEDYHVGEQHGKWMFCGSHFWMFIGYGGVARSTVDCEVEGRLQLYVLYAQYFVRYQLLTVSDLSHYFLEMCVPLENNKKSFHY
jgi:hypothetical protein